MKKLPQDLDSNAEAWKTYVQSIVELDSTSDFTNHVPGELGVYTVTFTVRTFDGKVRRRYYVGQGNPQRRLYEHRSEFRNCKATTRTGKSKLYCAEFLGDAKSWQLDFFVHESNRDREHALEREREIAAELREIYGDQMITKPRKKALPSSSLS